MRQGSPNLPPQSDFNRVKLRKYEPTLPHGLEILNCFQPDDRALGNAHIAGPTGLPKATVCRMAYPLCELGFLSFIELSDKYQLSTTVVSLGCGARGGRILAEEKLGSRISGNRARMAAATGGPALVSNCPSSLTLFEDDIKSARIEENLVPRDIPEIVLKRLAAPTHKSPGPANPRARFSHPAPGGKR